MNGALSTSSDEWMQLYQQTVDDSFGCPDFDMSAVTSLSPGSGRSSLAEAAQRLTPKACISKPVRRRFRASKKTPTTLLNTDAKNFRSLVQQFTGCRRRSTSISFGKPTSGPVSINFALATDTASVLRQPFVGTNEYHSQLQQQEEHQQQCPQVSSYDEEEEECKLSFDSNNILTTDDYLLASCFPRTGSEIIPQGFVMDDMYFLA